MPPPNTHSGDNAFNTVCEKSGCFPVPAEQVTKSIIDYNWAIWCVFFARIRECISNATALPPTRPVPKRVWLATHI